MAEETKEIKIETSENLDYEENYPQELKLKEDCIWNAPLPERQENHFLKSILYLLTL